MSSTKNYKFVQAFSCQWHLYIITSVSSLIYYYYYYYYHYYLASYEFMSFRTDKKYLIEIMFDCYRDFEKLRI